MSIVISAHYDPKGGISILLEIHVQLTLAIKKFTFWKSSLIERLSGKLKTTHRPYYANPMKKWFLNPKVIINKQKQHFQWLIWKKSERHLLSSARCQTYYIMSYAFAWAHVEVLALIKYESQIQWVICIRLFASSGPVQVTLHAHDRHLPLLV